MIFIAYLATPIYLKIKLQIGFQYFFTAVISGRSLRGKVAKVFTVTICGHLNSSSQIIQYFNKNNRL